MTQLLKLPERFMAYCNKCEWEGELISADLPDGEIVKCPICGDFVLAGHRPTHHVGDDACLCKLNAEGLIIVGNLDCPVHYPRFRSRKH